jgi:hypothetical protein
MQRHAYAQAIDTNACTRTHRAPRHSHPCVTLRAANAPTARTVQAHREHTNCHPGRPRVHRLTQPAATHCLTQPASPSPQLRTAPTHANGNRFRPAPKKRHRTLWAPTTEPVPPRAAASEHDCRLVCERLHYSMGSEGVRRAVGSALLHAAPHKGRHAKAMAGGPLWHARCRLWLTISSSLLLSVKLGMRS